MRRGRFRNLKTSTSICFRLPIAVCASARAPNHLLDRFRADNLRVFRFVVEKILHLRNGSIEGAYDKTFIRHIEDEILAHDGD